MSPDKYSRTGTVDPEPAFSDVICYDAAGQVKRVISATVLRDQLAARHKAEAKLSAKQWAFPEGKPGADDA